MSAGSLYTYVESKEALFHLVFPYGLGLLPENPPALPLSTPAPERPSRCSSGPRRAVGAAHPGGPGQ